MIWLRSRVSALIFATIFILLSNCSENQAGIDNSPSEDKAEKKFLILEKKRSCESDMAMRLKNLPKLKDYILIRIGQNVH